jgi:predicted DNA-binding ribbon-helix-helix protein
VPSTMTEPVGVRLRPADLDRLQKIAEQRDTTRSALVAELTREGLKRIAAAT